MAEPLTKDDLICRGCNHRAGDRIPPPGKGCCPDGDYSLIKIINLKSALEYLKAKMKGCMTNRDVQEEIEKAFPAIYEHSDKECEVRANHNERQKGEK
jgi:hypothetical protein